MSDVIGKSKNKKPTRTEGKKKISGIKGLNVSISENFDSVKSTYFVYMKKKKRTKTIQKFAAMEPYWLRQDYASWLEFDKDVKT